MKKIYSFLGWVLIPIFFASCASVGDFFLNKPSKEALSNKQGAFNEDKKPAQFKLIYIKTALFKYYDYGILDITPKDIQLKLFKLGKTIGSISIGPSQICFLSDCAPKWPAAKEFFGKVSYGDLFEDILLGKDIFGGIGKQIAPNDTLIQRFQKSGEIIFYERKKGHILFRNMTTGVAIAIDDYDSPNSNTQTSPTSPSP
ncbi:hypothetical protein BKH46_06890 [Helicobacter sp. 12S02634-8]|uniref:HP0838 family lipoprotein n=1 Tax=Helicobacter sp. 12S02634-8 TaxID=1476199 RepID=UPI000BA72F00|nr:hypothetical protein [Helicobacter sp. 12S02634-8]PAF46688.1 hypothetical protein BKH46_06890 [Helicobacter sp. 12S02634-8]